MRIALLQYSPALGKTIQNIARVRQIIARNEALNKKDRPVDLLVFPELAFSGYAFPSRHAVSEHLESAQTGRTSSLLREFNSSLPITTSIAGYPESCEDIAYNSAMVVQGQSLIYNHRKKHLFETDETWAQEGRTFGSFTLELSDGSERKACLGICMDINPYRFEAAFEAYEFGHHCCKELPDLVIVSMAWLAFENTDASQQQHLQAAKYWITRMGPLLDLETHLIFCFCNRCGQEGEVRYEGQSCVIELRDGKLSMVGSLDSDEGVLVVDVDI